LVLTVFAGHNDTLRREDADAFVDGPEWRGGDGRRRDLDLASTDRLEREVGQQRAAGVTRILIDLGDVDFIDSTGLRLLLTLRNDAKRNAHALTLVPPAPPARRLFTITGTRALFDWELDRAGP
jgi:anti-anti-sigma factor